MNWYFYVNILSTWYQAVVTSIIIWWCSAELRFQVKIAFTRKMHPLGCLLIKICQVNRATIELPFKQKLGWEVLSVITKAYIALKFWLLFDKQKKNFK